MGKGERRLGRFLGRGRVQTVLGGRDGIIEGSAGLEASWLCAVEVMDRSVWQILCEEENEMA